MYPLQGLTLVFTGKMKKNRDEMEEEARHLGAWVERKISSSTSYLVKGQRPGKKKLEEAMRQGCKIIDEGEYRGLINKRKRETASDHVGNPQQSETTAEAPDREWWSKVRSQPSRINW